MSGSGVQAGKIEVVDGAVGGCGRYRFAGVWARLVALGKHGEIFQRDGIGVGNYVAWYWLARSVRIVGDRRVVYGIGVRGKVTRPLRGGGNREEGRIELRLLRRFVVAKEEELLAQDGAADGTAFLIAMKVKWLVGGAVGQLALLEEVIVGGENVRPENSEGVAMEAVTAGLAGQADNARASALVRGRRVLGFDAVFVHAVFRNLRHGDDGSDIVFRNPQRATVEHVIHRPEDGAIDAVRGDIDTGPPTRDVIELHRVARVWRAVGRGNAGAQLHQVIDIARKQGDAIDGFGADELADGGVAGIDDIDGLRDGDRIRDLAHLKRHIHDAHLVHTDGHIIPGDAFKPSAGGRNFIGTGIERDKGVQARAGRHGGLRDPCCVVERGHFGAGDQRTRGVRDGATDATPAGLGPGGCTGRQEKHQETEENAQE